MSSVDGPNLTDKIKDDSNSLFRNMDISLENIYYFIRVVEVGTISGAAEALYVSQPNLSKIIKKLEEKLGFELFMRNDNRIRLTPKGLEFYEFAKPWCYSVLEKINKIKSKDNARLYIAVNQTVDFIRILEQGLFSDDFPLDKCDIEYMDPFTVVKKFKDGSIDIAITSSDYYEDLSNYQIIPITHKRRRIIISAGNEFAGRESISFSELAGKHMVFHIEAEKNNMPESVFTELEKKCSQYGINVLEASFEKNYQTALLRLLTNPEMVMMGVDLHSSFSSDRIVSVPIDDSSVEIGVVVSNLLSEEKRSLLRYFKKA